MSRTGRRYRFHSHVSDGSARGGILIEFIIVAPLMLFTTFYSLRFIQILQAHQIATTLSREIATELYRNCADYTILDMTKTAALAVKVDTTKAALKACRDKVVNKYQGLMLTLRPTSATTHTLEATIYRYDLSTLSIDETCSQLRATTKIAEIAETGLPPGATGGTMSAAEMCKRNRVVQVRIQFTLSLLQIPFAPNANNFRVADETLI